MPEQKLKASKDLRDKHGTLAIVGDGVKICLPMATLAR